MTPDERLDEIERRVGPDDRYGGETVELVRAEARWVCAELRDAREKFQHRDDDDQDLCPCPSCRRYTAVNYATACEQLRDARAEVEKFRERLDEHVGCEHRAAAELRKLHAELAAERAKVQRIEAAFDEWEAQPNLYSPAFAARFLRAALTGGEQGE